MKRFITLSAALLATLALCSESFARGITIQGGRIQGGQTLINKIQGMQTQINKIQGGQTLINKTQGMQTQIIKNTNLHNKVLLNKQYLCHTRLNVLCRDPYQFRCYLQTYLGCTPYFKTCGCFWSYSCFVPSYGCTLYYCPVQCVWFYWCAPYCCYLPVEFCPLGTYVF